MKRPGRRPGPREGRWHNRAGHRVRTPGQEEPEPPMLVAGQRPPPDGQAEKLPSREREVALLVARGLTNREIASELSVSRSTANNHVASILRKLGLRSRAPDRRLGNPTAFPLLVAGSLGSPPEGPYGGKPFLALILSKKWSIVTTPSGCPAKSHALQCSCVPEQLSLVGWTRR